MSLRVQAVALGYYHCNIPNNICAQRRHDGSKHQTLNITQLMAHIKNSFTSRKHADSVVYTAEDVSFLSPLCEGSASRSSAEWF